jgi:hypothetical protein
MFMNDSITRLRFKKPVNDVRGTTPIKLAKGLTSRSFVLYRNTNELEEVLDVSIHEALGSGEGVLEGTPPLIKKDAIRGFHLQVNNSVISNEDVNADDINPTDVIIKKGRDEVTYEAIYQLSVPFRLFAVGQDNVVAIDVLDKSAKTPTLLASFSLEFFTETENNFINVRLERPGTEPTEDQVLWLAIKNNLKFSDYVQFIDKIICTDSGLQSPKGGHFNRQLARNRSPFVRSDEYNLIKFGTEFYMMAKFGLNESQMQNYLGSNKMLPYYDIITDRIKDDLQFEYLQNVNEDCYSRGETRLTNPFMIELIWSYWMEQAGLVQTLNIINLRFQNLKSGNLGDRLQRLDIDPLRPLSHILWGYIQDEQHRLSIPRRLNEYDHEYGLILTGKAVPPVRSIDPRVPFLEAFHNLLNQCIYYFRESDDTTRIADAFPILNSLKEVHLLLAEGNHNAYGNLTWTARQEMMMQQYILSRTEMRDFLGGRTMVPYPETWMDRVDTMRSIQGWGGAGVMYYYELAIHGEQILLSIRYGNWSDVTLTGDNAGNWAKEFRNSIQRYVHAYRAVTGVDLTAERVQLSQNFATQPAFLIQQRLTPDGNRFRQNKLPAPLFRL